MDRTARSPLHSVTTVAYLFSGHAPVKPRSAHEVSHDKEGPTIRWDPEATPDRQDSWKQQYAKPEQCKRSIADDDSTKAPCDSEVSSFCGYDYGSDVDDGV